MRTNPITAAIAEATGAREIVVDLVLRRLRARDLVSGRAQPGRTLAYTDPGDAARLIVAMLGRRSVVSSGADLARNLDLVADINGREQRLVDMLESLLASLIAGQSGQELGGVVALRISVSTTWPCGVLTMKYSDGDVRTVQFHHEAARLDGTPDQLARLAVEFGLKPAEGAAWGEVDLDGLRKVAAAIRARHPSVAEAKPGALPFALTLQESGAIWAHAAGPPPKIADLPPEVRALAERHRALKAVEPIVRFLLEDRGLQANDVAAAMIMAGADLLHIGPCTEADLRLARELRDALNTVIEPDPCPNSNRVN